MDQSKVNRKIFLADILERENKRVSDDFFYKTKDMKEFSDIKFCDLRKWT